MKDKFVAFSVSVLALFAALFISEGVLGLVGFSAEPPLSIAHAPNHTDLRTSLEFTYTIRTNSQGIRYPEIPLEKSPGELRVVVLGDSFTEGKGVEAEHTFPAYLEERFSAGGKKCLFINCGLIGAGPEEYARILRQVGFGYHPDLVLLTVYANDIADTTVMSDDELRTGQGWLVPRTTLKRGEEKRRGAKAVLHRLFPRIYALLIRVKEKYKSDPRVSFTENVIQEARQKKVSEERIREWTRSLPPELARAADEGRFDGYMLAHGLLRPDLWLESLDIQGDVAGQKWRTAEAIFTYMARECEKRGVPLAVIYAPGPQQYDPTYVSPSKSVGTAFRAEWLSEESEFEKKLSAWTSANGLPFLNMTPAFREAAAQAPGSLNFRMDPHWTPAGNRLAADLIAAWLKKEKRLIS